MRIIFLMILLFSSAHLLAHGIIMIEGVEHSEGFIDVKIYENEDSFLKEEMASEVIRKKATQLNISPSTVQAVKKERATS